MAISVWTDLSVNIYKRPNQSIMIMQTPERKAYMKAYNSRPERLLERALHTRRIYALERHEALIHYSSTAILGCDMCGEQDEIVLTIDHINGGGTQHRKTLGWWGSNMYHWLKSQNWPEGYRVLCANCQMRSRKQIMEQRRKYQ